jgi:hypothetical protein
MKREGRKQPAFAEATAGRANGTPAQREARIERRVFKSLKFKV